MSARPINGCTTRRQWRIPIDPAAIPGPGMAELLGGQIGKTVWRFGHKWRSVKSEIFCTTAPICSILTRSVILSSFQTAAQYISADRATGQSSAADWAPEAPSTSAFHRAQIPSAGPTSAQPGRPLARFFKVWNPAAAGPGSRIFFALRAPWLQASGFNFSGGGACPPIYPPQPWRRGRPSKEDPVSPQALSAKGDAPTTEPGGRGSTPAKSGAFSSDASAHFGRGGGAVSKRRLKGSE
jgi:hypothetical protein